MKGKVKWFQRIKGYGFIIEDTTGEEFFCHHSQISSEQSYKYLNQDERVTFDPEPSRNGKLRTAVNIKTDASTNEVGNADRN